MSTKERFSLEDLNKLSEGLGDRICSLFDFPNDEYAYREARKKIEELLLANKLESDDVLVNRGMAEGLTIKEAFCNAENYYKFQCRFNG